MSSSCSRWEREFHKSASNALENVHNSFFFNFFIFSSSLFHPKRWQSVDSWDGEQVCNKSRMAIDYRSHYAPDFFLSTCKISYTEKVWNKRAKIIERNCTNIAQKAIAIRWSIKCGALSIFFCSHSLLKLMSLCWN
jgi:hypothetical protein